MALVDLPSPQLYPFHAATTSRYAFTADAASEGVMWCGVDIPLTGTLTHVCFSTGSYTSTATVDVDIQTVGSGGMGSGSLYVANANGTIAVSAANTVYECAINAGGGGVSVTKGDNVCVRVAQPAASPGNFTIVAGGSNSSGYRDISRPFIATNAGGGAYAKDGTQTVPHMGFKYSGGVYVPIPSGFAPSTASGGDGVYNSTSSPDERGNRMVVPFKCRAAGIWTVMWSGATGDYRVNLRNSSDTVIAQGVTVDGDSFQNSDYRYHLFPTPVTLSAGDVVHATMEAMTATNIGELQRFTTSSNALLALNPGGSGSYKVTYVNGGTRTYTDTQVLSIGLLLDQLDDGAGAGGLAANPIRGFVA